MLNYNIHYIYYNKAQYYREIKTSNNQSTKNNKKIGRNWKKEKLESKSQKTELDKTVKKSINLYKLKKP